MCEEGEDKDERQSEMGSATDNEDLPVDDFDQEIEIQWSGMLQTLIPLHACFLLLLTFHKILNRAGLEAWTYPNSGYLCRH